MLRQTRTPLFLFAVLLTLFFVAAKPARADNFPPFYGRNGTLTTVLQSIVYSGFQGQGTCSITVSATNSGTGGVTLNWGPFSQTGFTQNINPVLYAPNGAVISTTGAITVNNPGNPVTAFFQCPNIQFLTIVNSTSDPTAFTIGASSISWPFASSGAAPTAPGGVTANGYNSAGPQAFLFPDGTATFNISAVGNTTLVAGVAGKNVYVLGYNVSLTGGTSPTWQLGNGAGANCTSPTQITPPLGQQGGTSAVFNVHGGGVWLFKTTIAGSSLCLMAGGTTPAFAGWLSYAQLAGP